MRKFVFLLLFSIISSNSFAAVHDKGLVFKTDTPIVVPVADGATQGEIAQELLRAVEADADTTKFNKTAHTGGALFYLGAEEVSKEENALVCSQLVRSTDGKAHSLSLTPIAPEITTLNNESDQENPLYDAKINQLGLARVGSNAWPIVVKEGGNNTDASDSGVYVVTNPNDGSMVFSTNCLNNADGKKLDETAAGAPFAVTSNTANSWQTLRIFAGVDQSTQKESCNGTTANLGTTDNPGIAVLKFNTKISTSSNDCGEQTSTAIAELIQIDNAPDSVINDSQAAAIDKVAYDTRFTDSQAKVHLAFFENGAGTPANITSDYDFHFDPVYNQLFVGIDQVGRTDNNIEGGILSVVTAKIDSTDKLVVKPIVVGPRQGNFTNDSEQHIVGFYTDQNTDLQAATKKVRVMHTTTGKDYLITVGGVTSGSIDELNTWVNALPILPPSHTNPGRLAKTNGSDDFEPFGATDKLLIVDRTHDTTSFVADEKKIVVGVDPRFIGTDDTNIVINSIDVVGNTVYVGVAGDNANREGSGIYASSALFDEDGLVRSWTPWQRVATSDKVHGCGIDKATGNFQFLTEDDQDGKILVKSTAWGNSENVATVDRKLTSVLNTIFPNGVYKLCNFNDESPAFSETDKMSMMVAVGDSKVTLIQTGTNNSGVVNPVAEFELDTNVFVFDKTNSEDLEKIGPLLSCAMQREGGTTDNGYLYVGGCNGCARLENGSADGWATDPGLSDIATIKDFSFNEIEKNGDFGEILALDANESCVFVMGRKKFAAFGLDKQVVAGSEFDVSAGQDMLITGELIVYASTEGLFTLDPALNYAKTAITGIEGIPVELHYLSETRNVPSSNGNLMVLAVDKDKNLARIYRFDVQGKTLNLVDIVNESVEFSGFRRHINPETSTIYHSRSRSDDQSDFLDIKTVDGNSELDASLTDRLELGTNATYLAQAPVRDTTSGGLVFAGDWGVRVNE